MVIKLWSMPSLRTCGRDLGRRSCRFCFNDDWLIQHNLLINATINISNIISVALWGWTGRRRLRRVNLYPLPGPEFFSLGNLVNVKCKQAMTECCHEFRFDNLNCNCRPLSAHTIYNVTITIDGYSIYGDSYLKFVWVILIFPCWLLLR